MKKYGALIALGFAVLFGVLAVLLANKWMSSQVSDQAEVQQKSPIVLTDIVVAAEDIDIGSPLTSKNLTKAKWPKANMPKGAFEDITQLDGRVAVTKLTAGEPVLAAELAAPGSGAGLVAIIPKGMRAISIRVDEVIGVAGFVLPNTFVDVICVEKKGQKDVASIILEKVRVLAIAQQTFTEEGKAKVVRTVTMELKPDDATKLALKTRKGSIHLALRSPLEGKRVAVQKPEPQAQATGGPSIRTLRSKIYRPKLPPHDVEIIRASSREMLKFKNIESEHRVQ